MLDDALAYGAQGWPVFPLAGRTPRTTHGFHDASCDADTITAWWTGWPTANVGLRCGDVFDVLDVDHDDFVEGVTDLPDCETAGGPVVRTGSGRFHLYFAATGLPRRIRFSRCCDWLGRGGYVIAPPSDHPSGGRYEWYSSPSLDLHPPPAELLAVLDRWRSAERPADLHRRAEDRLAAPGRGWSPQGLYGRLATAVEGERNSVLHWCAARVGDDARAGRVDTDTAVAALEQLAELAERQGLGRREVDATIRSGWRG